MRYCFFFFWPSRNIHSLLSFNNWNMCSSSISFIMDKTRFQWDYSEWFQLKRFQRDLRSFDCRPQIQVLFFVFFGSLQWIIIKAIFCNEVSVKYCNYRWFLFFYSSFISAKFVTIVRWKRYTFSFGHVFSFVALNSTVGSFNII